MIYREFQGKKLSALGFGAMRLPVLNGVDTDIDQTAAAQMVECAMQGGINYYDTAWGYHGGASERILGKLLSKYPRDSYYLASKFPGYDLSNMDKVEEIFEAQLARCGVNRFDFYLFHNVCEMNIDAYLDESHGIFAYLRRQKESGRIGHLGFSAHGSLAVIERFLCKYGAAMEFGQLQVNYLDWRFQNAEEKVALLKKHNIPVWVMEPLRGGKLARLPEPASQTLHALNPDLSIPAWAFRFVQNIPTVKVILSGMSDLNQVKDNLKTFETDSPMGERERKALMAVADDMTGQSTLPCTACRYCTDHCPKGLDIPALVKLYNEHRFTGGGFIAPMALSALPEERWPSACVGCKSCERVCPQQIGISEMMRDFTNRLR